MKVLVYLLIPALVVAAFATISWARNRQPTSLDSGIDAFQREMRALSPDAAPLHRRRGHEPGASDVGRVAPARSTEPRPQARPPTPRPRAPRRPPTPDRGP